MENFLKGFEKQANIFTKAVNVVKGSKEVIRPSVSHKLLTGDQFKIKQQALLAARKAGGKTPAAESFISRAGHAAKEIVSAPTAPKPNVSLNSRSDYRKAGLGVDRVD